MRIQRLAEARSEGVHQKTEREAVEAALAKLKRRTSDLENEVRSRDGQLSEMNQVRTVSVLLHELAVCQDSVYPHIAQA